MSTDQTPGSGSADNSPNPASEVPASTAEGDLPEAAAGASVPVAPHADDPRPPETPAMAEEQRIQADIPWGVRIAAAWSWRAIIILIAIGVAVWLLGFLLLLIIPLMIAALLSTLLRPLHNGFLKLKFPRLLAALSSIAVMLTAVFGILYLVGSELIQGFAQMADQVMSGIFGLIDWADQTAQQLGFDISADQFNQALEELVGWVQQNQDTIMSSAVGFSSAATNVSVGTVLMLFTLIFFLSDGRRIWEFVLVFAPSKHRPAIHGAGRRGWTAVGTYMRVQVFVAFVDAVGIGLGAWLLDVPLVLPIAVLVFFGGFIPIVGAFVTGAIAVLLAWVAHDFVTALLMLGVVLLVQQLESNVLQPIVMGKAIKLHPLAVILAITAGSTLMGIAGALFAVPVLAFIIRATKYLTEEEWRADRTALQMERELQEERLKRAARREQHEAEEQANLATLKERIFDTIPGLDPRRSPFARRAQDPAEGGSAEDPKTPEAEAAVPAPKPAADADHHDEKRER